MNHANPNLKHTEDALRKIEAEEVERNKVFEKAPDHSNAFYEFLGEYDDAETFDMANEDELKKRFAAFKQQEVAIKGIKSLYKKDFEARTTLSLDDDTFEAVEDYIRKEARTNPESIKKLADSIDAYTHNQERIISLEKEFREYEAHNENKTVGEAVAEQKQALVAVKNRGIFRRMGRAVLDVVFRKEFKKELPNSGGIQKEEERTITLKNVDNLLNEVNKKEKIIEDSSKKHEELRNKMAEAKDEIFVKFAPLAEVHAEIKEKLKDKFLDVYKDKGAGKKFETVEKATQELEHVMQHGAEFLDDKEFTDEFSEEVTEVFNLKFVEKMSMIIDKSMSSNNRFKEMQTNLDKLVGSNALPQYEKPEFKQWMIEQLGEIRDNLEPDTYIKKEPTKPVEPTTPPTMPTAPNSNDPKYRGQAGAAELQKDKAKYNADIKAYDAAKKKFDEDVKNYPEAVKKYEEELKKHKEKKKKVKEKGVADKKVKVLMINRYIAVLKQRLQPPQPLPQPQP